jgi:quercetin dioxygenase-like cupin family protein
MEHTTKNQFFLKKGELKEITPNSVITVSNGLVWVTVMGDKKDYVLKTGDSLQVFGEKPVIEAIRGTYIQVQEPASKFKLISTILSWNADVFG